MPKISDLPTIASQTDSDLFAVVEDISSTTKKETRRELRVSIFPPGLVASFAGVPLWGNWLPCDGATVSRTTYAELFATIGTTFGVGDGATTFGLPDLRGRSAIGEGTGAGLSARALGATGGAETHSLTTSEMPGHTHGFNTGGNFMGVSGAGSYGFGAGANGAKSQSTTASAGGSAPHENMHPFLVLYPYISY